MTGGFGTDGQATEQGYQLWVDNINKGGGILGHQVKLDILNDSSKLNQTITNYQTLITVHHDDLVVGPFADDFTLAAARVAARYGYALVEGSGTAPTAAPGSPKASSSPTAAGSQISRPFRIYNSSSSTSPSSAVQPPTIEAPRASYESVKVSMPPHTTQPTPVSIATSVLCNGWRASVTRRNTRGAGTARLGLPFQSRRKRIDL